MFCQGIVLCHYCVKFILADVCILLKAITGFVYKEDAGIKALAQPVPINSTFPNFLPRGSGSFFFTSKRMSFIGAEMGFLVHTVFIFFQQMKNLSLLHTRRHTLALQTKVISIFLIQKNSYSVYEANIKPKWKCDIRNLEPGSMI